ncbi:MAG: hypothetical protein ACE5DM_00755 [Candidatus Nanoarchaeia archaeon]
MTAKRKLPSGKSITSARVIQTGVDKLVDLVKMRGEINIRQVTKELGVTRDVVEEWADFLESEKILFVDHRFTGTFLKDRTLSSEERKELIKDANRQGVILQREMRGAVEGIKRDEMEIRLVSKEFSDLHDYVKKNLEAVSGQCAGIVPAKKGGKGYAVDRSDYSRMISDLDAELLKIDKKRKSLEALRVFDETLERNLESFHALSDDLKSALDKELKILGDLEARIGKKVKGISKLKNRFKRLRSAVSSMESSVGRVDVSRPSKDLAAKASRMMAKVKRFLSEGDAIKGMILELEMDGHELEKHYKDLDKKTASVIRLARKSPVPKGRWEEINEGKNNLDTLRVKFSKDLAALREALRRLVK